jgi:hypothetical protein
VQRLKLCTSNPVAIAIEFQSLVQNVLSKLIGCKLNFESLGNSRQVRTWYYKDKSKNNPHHKGVFGHITAFFGCIETQQRGALHFHLLLWGGITPKLLEKAAGNLALSAMIRPVVDSMYTAELPLNIHVSDILKKEMQQSNSLCELKRQIPEAMQIPPTPISNNDAFNMYWYNLATNHNMHKHSFTCMKPPHGHLSCRLAKPSGLSSITKAVQIRAVDSAPNHNNQMTEFEEMDRPNFPQSNKDRDYQIQPYPKLDDRTLVWELQRPILNPLESIPQYLAVNSENYKIAKAFCIQNITKELIKNSLLEETTQSLLHWLPSMEPLQVIQIYNNLNSKLSERNGLVVESNVTIANATGSCTNAVLLGNTEQSKSAVFYVAPYLCKNRAAISNCLTALEAANEHISKHPSKADDSTSNKTKRNTQYLFTRTLHQLYTSMEVSDTQAALTLLGMGSELCSDSFQYVGVSYAINLLLNEFSIKDCEHDEDHEKSKHLWMEIYKTVAKSNNNNIKTNVASLLASNKQREDNIGLGPASLYTIQNKEEDNVMYDLMDMEQYYKVPIPQAIHWRYRGKVLANITFMEYATLIKNNTKNIARKSSKQFP